METENDGELDVTVRALYRLFQNAIDTQAEILTLAESLFNG
jgi:hypothetical protein